MLGRTSYTAHGPRIPFWRDCAFVYHVNLCMSFCMDSIEIDTMYNQVLLKRGTLYHDIIYSSAIKGLKHDSGFELTIDSPHMGCQMWGFWKLKIERVIAVTQCIWRLVKDTNEIRYATAEYWHDANEVLWQQTINHQCFSWFISDIYLRWHFFGERKYISTMQGGYLLSIDNMSSAGNIFFSVLGFVVLKTLPF